MKIIRVKKQPIDVNEKNFYADAGMSLIHLSPTLLSAATAMKLAKAIDNDDIDVIEVVRNEDAIAAVSARSITRKKPVIVFKVQPNTERPKKIHHEILESINSWIFPSERMSKLYPEQLKNRLVINTTSFSPIKQIDEPSSGTPVITWIGEIKDAETLKSYIDIIDSAETDVHLRICGMGKARDVMPVVRYARAAHNPDRITWLGEEFDMRKEISLCHAALMTQKDITEIEAEICLNGKPVINSETLADYLINPSEHAALSQPTPSEYIDTLHKHYTYILLNKYNDTK